MRDDPTDTGEVVGVDVGGTFTDIVRWDGSRLTTGKLASSAQQNEAVMEGAGRIGASHGTTLLHGTTVATNALLERTGAVTAFVTTEGFTDIIEIGRQNRPELYDPFAARSEPLAPAHLRFGVAREGPIELDGAAIEGVEAIAISLLYGYEESDRERAIAAVADHLSPGTAISTSSRVAPVFREFERASTTLLNAYLTPTVAGYLQSIEDAASSRGTFSDLAVMRSSGGLMTFEAAARLPAAILLSGPAAGVVAAAAFGDFLGKGRIISFDMGGTSTDVCRVEAGVPEVAYGRSIDGYTCLMPAVAIHSVGAGGGSIAWIDDGGSLRVGPASAGAHPGPAAYGRGGLEATVTDANIALGRIDPGGLLAGHMPLRADLAADAIATIGRATGLSVEDAAAGIVAVAEEVMAGALRKVSVEQGVDPRDSTLVAFGGAGGLHAASLARRLDMEAAVIPPYSGVLSALGLLMSPPRVDVARSVMLLEESGTGLDGAVAEQRSHAEAELAGTIGPGYEPWVSSVIDARYAGQSHELSVPYQPGEGWEVARRRFDELHEERSGFSRPNDAVEVVTVRAHAVARAALGVEQLPLVEPRGEARLGTRSVFTTSGWARARVYRRAGLVPGRAVEGPAVIEEEHATTFVNEGESLVVGPRGSMEISW